MVAAVPAQFAGQTLTDAQTVSWAQQAGFTGNDLYDMVAISFAENQSRRIDAVSPANSDGSHDYGEWQINDKAHADLFVQFPNWWTVSNADMAAAVVSHGGGKGAWTTYANGDYLKFLDRAAAAIVSAQGNPVLGIYPGANVQQGQVDTTSILTQIGNAVASIAQGVFKGVQWIGNPSNWVRVALVTIGGIIVIGGVVEITKSATGAEVPPIAKKAAEAAVL